MNETAPHIPANDGEVIPLPARGRNLTDLGNAERFVCQHRVGVRYVPQWRTWLRWHGQRWVRDETGEVIQLAKQTVRSIYHEAAAEKDDDARRAISKHAARSEAIQRLRAMLELAQSEPGIAVQPHQLDSDPMLLNCANGTIDLLTGVLRPHQPSDLITKLAPADFIPDATHDAWERFIAETTDADADIAGFLQRLAGYCATGRTSEKHFFFAFGPPDTGKSTFLDALAAALGDYAMTAAPETWLIQTAIGGNRGDLARLVGARLVSSSEFRRGAKFDESTIKSITGGDPLTCAAKYQAEFTYRPSFKLLFAANDAPRIADTDEGMWERCLRIPFQHSVPADRRDPRLKQALIEDPAARAAVLAWVVRGALEWQREGLGVPEAVRRSTAEYRAENDPVGDFLDERLEFVTNARATRREVRQAYEEWCREEGIKFPLGPKELADRMRRAGAEDRRTATARQWLGVRVKSAWERSDTSDGNDTK